MKETTTKTGVLTADTALGRDDVKGNILDAQLLELIPDRDNSVELTPEVLKSIYRSLDKIEMDISVSFPKIVAEMTAEQRLAVVCWVFRNLSDHMSEPGTYRFLIYNRLGFDSSAYTPIQMCGGLHVHNKLVGDIDHG